MPSERSVVISRLREGYFRSGIVRDGEWLVRVYGAGYLDWAVDVERNGRVVFSNPCFLNSSNFQDEHEEPLTGYDEIRETLEGVAESMIEYYLEGLDS